MGSKGGRRGGGAGVWQGRGGMRPDAAAGGPAGASRRPDMAILINGLGVGELCARAGAREGDAGAGGERDGTGGQVRPIRDT